MGLFDFMKKKDAPKDEIEQIEKAETEFAKQIEKIIKESMPKVEEKKDDSNLDAIKHNKALFTELSAKLEEAMKAKDERINELVTKLGELTQKEELRNQYLEAEAKAKLENDAKSFVKQLIDEKKIESENSDRQKFFEEKYIKDKEDAIKTAEMLKPIIETETKTTETKTATIPNAIIPPARGFGSGIDPKLLQETTQIIEASKTN